MGFMVDIPWKKYAIIIELTRRLKDVSPQLGKTALQKMVYLLTEVYGVPSGYVHTLYTYGPYSADLASDIEFVASMGGIELKESQRGYSIQESEQGEAIWEKAQEFIEKHSAQFAQLVKDYGEFNAKELELRSTLVLLQRRGGMSKDMLVKQLRSIKPYFTVDEVITAVEQLGNIGHINPDITG
ncbi:hypothetical protein JCM15765_25410 [Paradesulfitobacterium aromaticivorans]